MNLTLERDVAAAALARAAQVATNKLNIPVLANVVLTAEEGGLSLRTTNLDMELVETIPAMVIEPSRTTVPADLLRGLVHNADAGAQISLKHAEDDPRLFVKFGRSNYKLPTLLADDFPTFASEGFGEAITMPAAQLAEMLQRALWATIPTDTNTIFGTVFFGTQQVGETRQLHAMGAQTSGCSLLAVPAPEGADFKTIIPCKIASHIVSWLGGAEGDVEISATDGLLMLRHGAATFKSKLFGGAYYNYVGRVLETHELTARVAQDELVRAVRRVNLVDDSDSKKPRALKLNWSDGACRIHMSGDSSADAVEEIGAEYEGPEAQMLITPKMLGGALSVLKGDIVELCFAPKAGSSGGSQAVVVRAPCDETLLINLAQPVA